MYVKKPFLLEKPKYVCCIHTYNLTLNSKGKRSFNFVLKSKKKVKISHSSSLAFIK